MEWPGSCYELQVSSALSPLVFVINCLQFNSFLFLLLKCNFVMFLSKASTSSDHWSLFLGDVKRLNLMKTSFKDIVMQAFFQTGM